MHATPAEIARKALADHLAALPAAELLKRYAARRDPEAFAGLVQQFGPMVFGVCRRVLGQAADADDAFQAVFLSLARQADSFRDPAALPAWLHRVALRVSHKALARRAGASAPPEVVPDPTDPFAELVWKDVRRALDEELDALPDKYRGPVVLCWLDGLTQDEAASKLGTSLATLKRRLDAGRDVLRARLVRRGLAPALAAGAVLDATGLTASVSESLKALAVELGVGGAVPVGVSELQVTAAAAGPTRRAALVTLLGVGTVAAAAGVALSRKPPAPVREVVNGEPVTAPAPEPGPPAPQRGSLGIPRNRIAHRTAATTVAWSPDGKTLATGSAGGEVTLWDARTGKLKASVGELERRMSSVAFCPDGKQLAAADERGEIRLWDVATLKEKLTLNLEAGRGWVPVNAIALSPDGKTLVSAGGDKTIRLWDPETGKEKKILKGHSESVSAVAFSPDGRFLASAAAEWAGKIKLWDATSGNELATIDPNSKVLSLAWSPNGKVLACATDEWMVRAWDMPTGKERFALKKDEMLGSASVVAFSPDSKTLASGHGEAIRLWDVANGTTRATLRGPNGGVMALSFSRDGTLASAQDDGTVKLWDMSAGQEQGTFTGHRGGVDSVAFSPDGKTLATGGGDSTVKLWDVSTRKERYAVKSKSENQPDTVHCVAWSPDGKTLFSASDDRTIKLWDTASGKEASSLKGHTFPIVSVAISPDGKTLASGAIFEKTVRLWDVPTGKEKEGLKHVFPVRYFAWSPDGKTLASASMGTVTFWDVAKGTEKFVHKPPRDSPTRDSDAVVWSPDGKTLAVLSSNWGTVQFWDGETGKEKHGVGGDHRDNLRCMAFSRDSKRLAVGGSKVIWLWNLETDEEPTKLFGPGPYVRSVAFSPDGKILASGGVGDSVLLWDVSPQK